MSSIVSTLTHSLSTAADLVHEYNALSESVEHGGIVPAFLAQDLEDVEEQMRRGRAFSLRDLPAYIDAVRHLGNGGIDDRKFLLEKLITLMARLPDDSLFAQKMNTIMVNVLYNNLQHPPQSFLSEFPLCIPNASLSNSNLQDSSMSSNLDPQLPFAHRTPTGLRTSLYLPTLGMAGMPYARSVPTRRSVGGGALPDAGIVFEMLLRRREMESSNGGDWEDSDGGRKGWEDGDGEGDGDEESAVNGGYSAENTRHGHSTNANGDGQYSSMHLTRSRSRSTSSSSSASALTLTFTSSKSSSAITSTNSTAPSSAVSSSAPSLLKPSQSPLQSSNGKYLDANHIRVPGLPESESRMSGLSKDDINSKTYYQTSYKHNASYTSSSSKFKPSNKTSTSSYNSTKFSSSTPGFVPHPSGLSSLFFAFANIIIHSLFLSSTSASSSSAPSSAPNSTSSSSWSPTSQAGLNHTSAYLDLSPLYGSSAAQTLKMRVQDGTGRIWEDTWADKRVNLMPPQMAALLVLWGRNHNYIAEKLLQINEFGAYVNPDVFSSSSSSSTTASKPDFGKREQQKLQQDEDIFNRARLVNCGLFMQVVLQDYVGAILGLTRDGLKWRVDALGLSDPSSSPLTAPRGQGNACSVEFNLMYRWHACLSREDEWWLGRLFGEIFGKDGDAGASASGGENGKGGKGRRGGSDCVTEADFHKIAEYVEYRPDEDPREWSIRVLPDLHPLQRDPRTNRFRDADLAKILMDATEAPAGAFRARGISALMKVVEVLGMEQARGWGVCALNEYRRFVGLKPYKSFKEWNPDPNIYLAAQSLYSHIDNLELYPGLFAEEAKLPMPGAGLCPGYTISRAILADAVALSRGDRFLTTEFTSVNYTTWGLQFCSPPSPDTSSASFGGVLPRLFYLHLPEFYPYNSVYAQFPFYVPSRIQAYLSDLAWDRMVGRYSFARPGAGEGDKSLWMGERRVVVKEFEGVREIIGRKGCEKGFEPVSVERCRMLFGGGNVGVGSLCSRMVNDALASPTTLSSFEKSFLEITLQLIHEHSFDSGVVSCEGIKARTMSLDIVKDVVNLVPVRFLCTHLLGLPIRTPLNPNGIFDEKDLYVTFADVCNFLFVNVDQYDLWALREKSTAAVDVFVKLIEEHLDKISGSIWSLSSASDTLLHWFTKENYASHVFLKDILSSYSYYSSSGHHKLNRPTSKELARSLFATIIGTSALYAKMLVNVVDYYLDEERDTQREDLIQLLRRPSGQVSGHVGDYIAEALRYNPPNSIAVCTAKTYAPLVDGRTVHPGDKIYCALTTASQDAIFDGAASSPPSREDFGPLGFFSAEPIGLLSPKFFQTTTSQVLRAIFGLKNLRRAPGATGKLRQIRTMTNGIPEDVHVNHKGELTPWPNSLHLQYDA